MQLTYIPELPPSCGLPSSPEFPSQTWSESDTLLWKQAPALDYPLVQPGKKPTLEPVFLLSKFLDLHISIAFRNPRAVQESAHRYWRGLFGRNHSVLSFGTTLWAFWRVSSDFQETQDESGALCSLAPGGLMAFFSKNWGKEVWADITTILTSLLWSWPETFLPIQFLWFL